MDPVTFVDDDMIYHIYKRKNIHKRRRFTHPELFLVSLVSTRKNLNISLDHHGALRACHVVARPARVCPTRSRSRRAAPAASADIHSQRDSLQTCSEHAQP